MRFSIILVALISCSHGIQDNTESFQAKVTAQENHKVHAANEDSNEQADGDSSEVSASLEIHYDVVDDKDLKAKIEAAQNAPGNLRGSADTIIPITLLEYVASWLHPAPPHHHAKHVNRSSFIRNLRNQTFMNELSKNKTMLMRFRKRKKPKHLWKSLYHQASGAALLISKRLANETQMRAQNESHVAKN